MKSVFHIHSKQEMIDLGKSLSQEAAFVSLEGELGAGKTIFVKGYVEGRGLSMDQVQSPTYAYLNRYGDHQILHADLYRLTSLEEAMQKGIIDELQRAPCRIVERPQRIQMYIQPGMLRISIQKISDTDRMVHVVKV